MVEEFNDDPEQAYYDLVNNRFNLTEFNEADIIIASLIRASIVRRTLNTAA